MYRASFFTAFNYTFIFSCFLIVHTISLTLAHNYNFLFLLSVILILVANSRSIRLWFAYSGVTFVVLGSLYLLSAFTGYIEVLINVIPVLSAFIAPLCLQFLIFGGSFFVVGLIMLIISHAIKKRQKKAMAQMNQMPQQA